MDRRIIIENGKKVMWLLFLSMLKKKLLFNVRNTFLVLGSKGSELV